MLARLEAATRAPAVILESPRGIADATLGAFSDLTRRADLIVLLGKALDFTTRWASGPAYDPQVRVIAIDPEAALVERAAREMDGRLALGCIADVRAAAETLIARAATAKAARRRLARGSARRARQPARRLGDASRRRRRAACTPRKCFARCALMSSAIPTRC